MKRRIWAILGVITLLSSLIVAAVPVGAGGPESRYVVVFQNEKIPGNAGRLIQGAGGRLAKVFPEIGVGVATSSDPGFAASLQGAKGIFAVGAERYQSLPTMETHIAEDGPVAGVDVYYDAYQWDIRRVRADQAWDITSGSHDTVVAILDTGIASNHPDLTANVIHDACYSVFAPCIPYPSYHWHGTHVAGTVAAAFGAGGAVGVGPNLGLANYNVFELTPEGDLGAYDSSIWMAMLDVATRGFDVINMSLGGYVVFPLKDAAVWAAWNRVAKYVTHRGVTIAASAGNAGADLNGPVAHIPSDLPGVISVGATGIRPDPVYPQEAPYDVLAEYSNYGAAVTLVAPGGDIGPEGTPWPFPAAFYLVFSTDVSADPVCAATESCDVGYAWAGGTSQASPHVAGVAGLIIDQNPGLSPHQVTSILKQTAESLGDRQLFGHGMVDAYAAVTK